jgi:hypothetical protein
MRLLLFLSECDYIFKENYDNEVQRICVSSYDKLQDMIKINVEYIHAMINNYIWKMSETK